MVALLFLHLRVKIQLFSGVKWPETSWIIRTKGVELYYEITHTASLVCHSIVSWYRPCYIFSHPVKWAFHRWSKNNDKKQQTKCGRKKRQNTNSEQQNIRRWSLELFFLHSVCMYVFGYHEGIVKLPTATKNADSSLVIIFTTWCPISDCTAPCSRLDCVSL